MVESETIAETSFAVESPPSVTGWHWLLRQLPPRQGWAHEPQLFWSLVRLTHAPEQLVGYAETHPQLPFPSQTMFEPLAPHGVPAFATGLEHVPVLMLHVPTVWQASKALQDFGLLPRHVPSLWHVCVCKHAFPASHVAPVATGCEHLPLVMSHVPTAWH